MGKKRIDYTGRRFGRWKAIEFDRRMNGTTYWICRCDCGATESVRIGNLVSGDSCSCRGCCCVGSRGDGWSLGKRVAVVRDFDSGSRWMATDAADSFIHGGETC
jgi:hypothetical protein